MKSVGPDDAPQMFGYLAGFVGVDNMTSSSATRALLSWEPTEPGLLEDLGQPHYFA